MDTLLVMAGICWAAVLVDGLLGEPRRWHPLVGFGAWVSAIERRLNRAPHHKPESLMRGAMGVLIAIGPILLLAFVLQHWLSGWAWFFAQVLGLWLSLSLRGLTEHGKAVSDALNAGDGDGARLAVGKIVSRDAKSLSDEGVAAAATESVLENGADAVFSSLFWYLVGGLPGVVLHRLINTLDAMWGYRSARFLYFGRTAARADDVLNWLPARLTALTYALLGHTRLALRCWQRQAKTWGSPNAGPVMAAGAGALAVRLGGPAPYPAGIRMRPVLGCGSEASGQTVNQAIALVQRGVGLWLLGVGVFVLVLRYGWVGAAV